MMDNMLYKSTLASDTIPPLHTFVDGAHNKATQPHFYRATYNLTLIVHQRLP